MKKFLLLLVAGLSAVVFAVEQSDIYPLRPDGTRDYTKPSQRIDGDMIYQLRKDGSRDYTQPAKRIEGDRIVPLRPDGTRDYTKPVLQIQKNSRALRVTAPIGQGVARISETPPCPPTHTDTGKQKATPKDGLCSFKRLTQGKKKVPDGSTLLQSFFSMTV